MAHAKKPTKKTVKKPAKKPRSAKKKPAKKPAKNVAPKVAKANPGDDRWWALIDRARSGGDDGDDVDEEDVADALVEVLQELSPDDIVAFDTFLSERIRDAFRSDLWAVAYIMNGGCSDDGFDYFIGWLIMKGKKHYEAALANPEDAAKGVSPDDEPFENESVYYAPSRAWAAKTGKTADDFYAIAKGVKRELQGELFDEDTVDEQYPKLAKKFGGG